MSILFYFLTFTLQSYTATNTTTKAREADFMELATKCTMQYSAISKEPLYAKFAAQRMHSKLEDLLPTALINITMAYLCTPSYHVYQLSNFQSRQRWTKIAVHPLKGDIAYGDRHGGVGILSNKTYKHTYLQTTGFNHYTAINAIEFSPQGDQLAAASRDSTVKIWKINNKAVPYQILTHTFPVTHLAWSPCGKKILSTEQNDNTTYLHIWNLTKGTREIVYQVNKDLSVCSWQDSEVLIALSICGTENTKIIIMNLHQNTLVKELSGQARTISKVLWSPDKKYIASTSTNDVLHLYNTATDECIWVQPAQYHCNMAWSPCSTFLATTANTADTWGMLYIFNVYNRALYHCSIPYDTQSKIARFHAMPIIWIHKNMSLCVSNALGNVFIVQRKDIYDTSGGSSHLVHKKYRIYLHRDKINCKSYQHHRK